MDGRSRYARLIPLTTRVTSVGGLAEKRVGAADIDSVTACSEFGLVCQAVLAFRFLAIQVVHIRRKKTAVADRVKDMILTGTGVHI